MPVRKTEELIHRLVADLKPQATAPSLLGFLLRASLVASVGLAVFFCVRTRDDLAQLAREPRYIAESAFWLCSALFAAVLVYRSSLPGQLRPGDQRWPAVVLACAVALVALRLRGVDLSAGLAMELGHRGVCGAIVLGVACVAGAGLFAWSSRAAPTRPGLTGVWIALCSGCLGTLAMQVFCEHDEALHVLLWHFLPVLPLAALGAFLGVKHLRWGPRNQVF